MFDIAKERWRQGHRTMRYPHGSAPPLPARFAGRPVVDGTKCPPGCRSCAEACPTGAVMPGNGRISLDTGLCVFCGCCVAACPGQAIKFTHEHRMAAALREDLVVRDGGERVPPSFNGRIRKLFGRSLKLRQVSAGGCNACEADTNVLNTLAWDLGRFGIQFVASPRHADGLLITGPVTRNMEEALQKTYDATPDPKIVIAVGTCAISGGLFGNRDETRCGAVEIIPVDLFVPGCPPHPATILDGLLRLIGEIGEDAPAAQPTI